jgi:hypothetical protein
VGKVGGLAALAARPEKLRARAPVGRMLEWHQMELVAGQLIAAAPFGAPILATRFVTMPSEVTAASPFPRTFPRPVRGAM